MQILTARYTSRAAFLAAFDASQPDGGLLIPSTRRLGAGAIIVVELAGRLLPERMLLRGVVVSLRPAVPRARQRAAVLVAFPQAERATVDFVLEIVRGTRVALGRRQSPRLPVSLALRYRRAGQSEQLDGTVVNLSVGGLALAGALPLPAKTPLVLHLPVPGAVRPLELAGEVVFAIRGGDRLGVRFDRRDPGGVHCLREAIRRLRGEVTRVGLEPGWGA